MTALAPPLTGDTMGGDDLTAAARGGVVGAATVRNGAPLSSLATFTSEAVASTLVCADGGCPSRPALGLAVLSCRSRLSSSVRRRSPSSARLDSSFRALRSSPLRRLSSASLDSFARASDVSRRGSGERRTGERRAGERREGERRAGERREGERREEEAVGAGLERWLLLSTRGELERCEDLVRDGEAERRLRPGDARERGDRERRSRRGEGERVRWLAAGV